MGVEAKAEVRTAKLFRNGRSQAVRLPKEFRFEGDEVRIRRMGESVVLEPVAPTGHARDWAWLDELREKFGPLDADFIAAVEEDVPQQERPELDLLFPEATEEHKQDRL
jgi:antitoxin VapB